LAALAARRLACLIVAHSESNDPLDRARLLFISAGRVEQERDTRVPGGRSLGHQVATGKNQGLHEVVEMMWPAVASKIPHSPVSSASPPVRT